MTLEPDKVSVEIEIGSSLLLLYGSVLRNFIHLKENIFGEDQIFTDMQNSKAPSAPSVVRPFLLEKTKLLLINFPRLELTTTETRSCLIHEFTDL